MLKEERQSIILDEINNNGIIQVSGLTDILDVTEMTIRRDLSELEEKGFLVRVHGGAKKIERDLPHEFSNQEKILLNREQKRYVAQLLVNTINDGERVFLGAGSTIEYASEFIKGKKCIVYTNSFYLFEKIKDYKWPKTYLIGGEFRSITGAFVGGIANSTLSKMNFQKSFIGANGVNGNSIYTYNEDEGYLQSMIFDNSKEKYLVVDSTKIGIEDLYAFYTLDKVKVITDKKISEKKIMSLKEYTFFIN